MRRGQFFRYAARKLWKRPFFALTTVACLALGIGATTAIFSVVNALLLRSDLIEDIDDVVFIMAMREGVEPFGVSPIELEAYRTRSHSFESLGLARTGRYVNLTDGDRPQRVSGASIAPSYLETLGVEPYLGRSFTAEEDRDGGPAAVLVSYALWSQSFGASPELLGSTVRIDGQSFTVVGILPSGFDLPAKNDLWFPLRFDLERFRGFERINHAYMLIGRLGPGVSAQEAESDLLRIAEQLKVDFPETSSAWSVALAPIRNLMLGDIQGKTSTMLYALAVAAGLLLLIACVNAAHLFLARFVEQEREIAVAAALGASRFELSGPFFAESLIVSLLAGALGSAAAFFLVPAVMARSALHEEAYTNLFRTIPVDASVLAFSFGVSILTAFSFGSVPALRALRRDVHGSLRAGASGQVGLSRARWSRAFIVIEIALSITLLAGAGLILRSFRHLGAMELGFRPQGLVTIAFTLPESLFPTAEDRNAFSDRLLERVRALPSVTAAGTTTDVPLDPGTWDAAYFIEGAPPPKPSEEPWAAYRVVSPGYLETLGVTLIRGRTFTTADREGAEPVAIVSEELARRGWPGEDPLGRRLRGDNDETWRTVIGVVRDVKEDAYNFRIDRPVWYVPYAQAAGMDESALSLVFRTEGDMKTAASEVRRAVAELFPELAPGAVRQMDSRVSAVMAAERSGTWVSGLLAIFGTTLASLGLYGVMAYSVRQRFRELGLRMALGADPRELRRLVLGHGLRLTVTGLACGLAGAVVLGRTLSNLLFEVSPYDPFTLSVVAAVLVAVALAASYLPARRASRTDPAAALRAE